MIKAVFFDIDGTIVPFGENKMLNSTVEALDTLKSRGVKLFIATGRSPANLKYLQSVLDYNFDGFVSMNGQYCYSGDIIIREQWFSKRNFPMLLKYLDEKNIACNFVELDYFYINRINSKVKMIRAALSKSLNFEPVDDQRRSLTHKIYQLSAYIDKEDEDELVRHFPGSKALRWSPAFADIIPEDGGKDVGISKVIEYFGIKREETMAFGDGGNDIDMLKFCGIGVAMGNAGDDVKEAADYVTDDACSDGIYNALRHYGVI